MFENEESVSRNSGVQIRFMLIYGRGESPKGA